MAGLLNADEVTWMTSTVASALDQSLPLYRPTKASDGYGHTTRTYPSTPTATIACNTMKPSATQLQTFADIIGTQEAMMLRFVPPTDVREDDRIAFQGENWEVQNVQNAESYSFALDALMTVIS